jgi:ankyrin repeat protein
MAEYYSALWQEVAQGLPLSPESMRTLATLSSTWRATKFLWVALWNDHAHTVAELLRLVPPALFSVCRLVDAELNFRFSKMLHIAASYGSCSAAGPLLAAKADVHQFNRFGHTPLNLATKFGHTPFVELLLEAKADVDLNCGGGNSLMSACDDAAVISVLLARKANVDKTDTFGRTALHVACKRGYASACARLLEAKADVEALDDSRQSPLNHAANWEGSVAVVLLLLEAKADATSRNRYGFTPAVRAVWSGDTDVARLLMPKEAVTPGQ